MIKIDYIAYNNPLANKNPYVKSGFAMGLLIAAISFKSVYLLAFIIFIMNALILVGVRIEFKFYLKLLMIPVSILGLSTMMILITYNTQAANFVIKCHAFGGFIGITHETLRTACYLFLRCFASICCIYFMTLTVGMNQLIQVLRKLHLPHEIIELLILMYRFIFIFLEEMEEMKRAQEMRFGYTDLYTSYHSTGMLISQLFKRIMQRYEELCVALEMKLYEGTFY